MACFSLCAVQVAFYIGKYTSAGIPANVGYELGTPAYLTTTLTHRAPRTHATVHSCTRLLTVAMRARVLYYFETGTPTQATTSYTSSRSPRVLSRRLPRRCRPSQQAASFGRFTRPPPMGRRARRPLRRPCARLSCLGARVARGRSRVWICEVDALLLLYAHEMLRALYTFSDSRAFRLPAQRRVCGWTAGLAGSI